MSAAESLVIAVYYGALVVLVLFGAHRARLTLALLRRADAPAPPALTLRPVTVQLPMYNERHVAERLIRAAAALDYPRALLQIQVLDDSTDETAGIVDQVAGALRREGVAIEVVRRPDRVGFKAGALETGLRTATGELIAVFDADFLPPADFLRRVVGEFDAPDVGMVQARWGHLNRDFSPLTAAQALLLDGHFVVEQTARYRMGAYFNFNGTAGVWRRRAIDEAGGWHHDTITEDLDLSYRGQLAGWRFVYRDDVVVPAELPAALTAFKSQQHRWAKGSIECLRKLGGRVLGARLPVRVKLEAMAHLSANLSYLPIVVVAGAMPLQTVVRQREVIPWASWADAALFVVGFVSVLVFYGVAARRAGLGLRAAAVTIPAAIALDIGSSLHKSRAVIEALLRHRSEFVRTPKMALVHRRRLLADGYVSRRLSAGAPELLMAGWIVWGLSRVGDGPHPSWLPIPFLCLFLAGFALVGGLAVLQGMSWSLRAGQGAPVADPAE